MDLGVWMSPAVLEHKIECATDGKSPEVPWNVRRLPEGFGRDAGPRRLYVASEGAWRGFFMLSDEVLYNPAPAQASWSGGPAEPGGRIQGRKADLEDDGMTGDGR